MKKYLLGTAAAAGLLAFVSGASAQEPLSVTVGGYLQFDAATVSQDTDAGQRSSDFRTSSEVHVRAEGTTDNGITYGAILELETDNSGTNNGDENHLYVSGGWGKLEFGDKSGVVDGDGLGIVAARDFGLGGVAADDESALDFVAKGTNAAFAGAELFQLINADTDGSSTKISYYSPVFNGFQAGFSYAPDQKRAGRDVSRLDVIDLDATTAQSANTDSFYQDIVELGAKYTTEFNNVGLAFSAGYVKADAKDDVDTDTGPVDYNDLDAYALGTAISFGGFTLSGNYTDLDDSVAAATGGNTIGYEETDSYSIGLQYETGPYVFGVNHLKAESEDKGNVLNDLEYKATSFGATYAAAPGWVAYAEGTMFNADDGTANTNDEGSVVLLGTRLSF